MDILNIIIDKLNTFLAKVNFLKNKLIKAKISEIEIVKRRMLTR